MIEEPSIQTRADILDLVISFLTDHEKTMDQMIQRLERGVEAQPRRNQCPAYSPEPKYARETRPNTFTITISSPGDLKHLKSLRIEWEAEQRAATD